MTNLLKSNKFLEMMLYIISTFMLFKISCSYYSINSFMFTYECMIVILGYMFALHFSIWNKIIEYQQEEKKND